MKKGFFAGLMCLALSFVSMTAIAGSSAYKSSAFGYASGTTGGGSATPTLVTTASQLESALNASDSKVIIITKDITVTNHISVLAKNKTLMAVKGVKLISNQQNKSYSGILYFKKGSTNIILRNLTFQGPGAYDCDGWDNLCFDGVTKAWVDHCDFQDGCDGNFDNKGLTDNITVSWCRFRYLKSPKAGGSGGTDDHRFSNLLGSSSSDKPSDGKYSMTWAYCWWDEGCVERMLRCRNAELHFLNCAWTSSAAHYYVGPQNACAQFDGCYFGVPTKPVSGKNYIFYQNYGGTNGCKFNNCSGNSSYMKNSGSVKTPSYSFSTLSASTAKSELASYAGATLTVSTSGSVSDGSSSSSSSSSSTTWDFKKITSKVILTGSNYNYSYNGLTLVGNTSSSYTNDYVSSAGFHCNGASTSSIRYIKYKPTQSGTLTVYFQSNNTSDLNRTTAIGKSVGSPIAKATCSTGKVSVSVSAGTTYYAYFVSGGQTITKVVFSASSSGAKSSVFEDDEEDDAVTAVNNVTSVKQIDPTAVYSLSGRKMLDSDNLAPGIYIRNGKKFVVK